MHRAQRQRAVPLEQQHPGTEGGRHAGGEQAGARHEVEAEAGECVERRRGRRRALAVQHERLPAGRVEADDGHLAGRAVQVRLDDLKHEAGGDRGVERVAAVLQHGHPGR